MNNITIHGRLTRDPELKTINGAKGDFEVCNFTVAVDRRFGEETDFFNCKNFGKSAEAINKFFCKGKEIVVSGEMQCRKYEDKDGKNRYVWELAVNSFDFCGKKSDVNENNSGTDTQDGFEAISDDDIPF